MKVKTGRVKVDWRKGLRMERALSDICVKLRLLG